MISKQKEMDISKYSLGQEKKPETNRGKNTEVATHSLYG